MSEQRMVSTLRDCPARLVPVGDAMTIPANNFVTITQSLGGNYTVVYQGKVGDVKHRVRLVPRYARLF